MSLALTKTLTLPDWVPRFVEAWTAPTQTAEERMALAVALSAENVARGTGGPFAAVVYEADTHRVVSAGVNVVVPQRTSLAHGEIVALLLAQEAHGTHDLGGESLPTLELVTSSQPCIQCYGAIIWSGVRRVSVAARGADVESIVGFDEGPVPADWVEQWALRGIETTVDVLRDQACDVLRAYKASGAPVYNSAINPRAESVEP